MVFKLTYPACSVRPEELSNNRGFIKLFEPNKRSHLPNTKYMEKELFHFFMLIAGYIVQCTLFI